MYQCIFVIVVGNRGYQVCCTEETAKKTFKECDLHDTTVIWQTRKPEWANGQQARKAA